MPESTVMVSIYGDRPLQSTEISQIASELTFRFGMNLDLTDFVRLATSDPVLGPVEARWRGMRPSCAYGLFELLCITIVLQNATVRRSTDMLRRLLAMRWQALGTWTWEQVLKRRFHTATTIGALAAGVTFTVAMATLLGSYRAAFVEWMNQMLNADVFINAGNNVSLLAGSTIDLYLAEELTKVDGVARVMPWRLVDVDFRGHPIIVQGMAGPFIERLHPEVSLDHGAGEVVISDTLAQRYGLKPGDAFELPAPAAPLSLRVAGVSPDYLLDLGNVKVEWDTFVRHFRERAANIIAVDAAEGVSGRDLKRRIEGAIAGRYDVSVLTGDELRGVVDALIDQSFALTYGLQVLAVLVTIPAMANATSAAILDRSRELTTWRALGLERVKLVRLLMVEAGLLGLLGSLMGLCTGSLMGNCLVSVVAPAVFGFRMEVERPFATMATMVCLTTAATVIAASLVARWQMRGTVASAEANI